MDTPKRSKLATTREVAEFLRLTNERVTDFMREGALKAYQLNGKGQYLFRWEEVEGALIQAPQVKAVAPIAKKKPKAKPVAPVRAAKPKGAR